MKLYPLILSAALAAPLALGAQTTPRNGAPSTQPPQISLQAQHFLVLLASEDQSEIDLAHLALKKSGNSQVRNYATSKILAADPAMKKGAQRLAQQEHAPVAGFPSSSAKAEFYYLSRLSGKAFDQAHMGYEDAKQNEDLIMVQNELAGAKNQQVKSYVRKEEPPVQQAAQSAKQIAQSLIG